MATPKKIELVEQIKKKLNEHDNLIITDYRGLSVKQITELRKKLYEKGVLYQVVKNNLVKIALKDSKIEGLDEYLFGPSAIVFAKDDPVFPSHVLSKLAKTSSLKIKGGYSEGKIISKDEIEQLAQLPSKDILLASLIGSLKSPANRLVAVLNGPLRSLVSVLQQISKQKND